MKKLLPSDMPLVFFCLYFPQATTRRRDRCGDLKGSELQPRAPAPFFGSKPSKRRRQSHSLPLGWVASMFVCFVCLFFLKEKRAKALTVGGRLS